MAIPCTFLVFLVFILLLVDGKLEYDMSQSLKVLNRRDCSVDGSVGCESNKHCEAACLLDSQVYCDRITNRCTTVRETTENAIDTEDESCLEYRGLVKVLTHRNQWECKHFTPYTDRNGQLVGGNCSGSDGVITYEGHLHCDCLPMLDLVTGKKYESRQTSLGGLSLCVLNEDLYEVD